MSRRLVILAALFLGAPPTGAAAADAPSAKGAAAQNALSSGEVKQIDKPAARITLKHGPLVNLDMPGMTMAFPVKDAAMLDRVKTGDKVSFVAERVNGEVTVTRLELAK